LVQYFVDERNVVMDILFYILLDLYCSINGENSLVYCPRVSKSRSCRASWFAGNGYRPDPGPRASRGAGREDAARERSLPRQDSMHQAISPSTFARNYIP